MYEGLAFSIAIDGSNDTGLERMNPVTVHLFNLNDGKVATCFLDMCALKSATVSKIYTIPSGGSGCIAIACLCSGQQVCSSLHGLPDKMARSLSCQRPVSTYHRKNTCGEGHP